MQSDATKRKMRPMPCRHIAISKGKFKKGGGGIKMSPFMILHEDQVFNVTAAPHTTRENCMVVRVQAHADKPNQPEPRLILTLHWDLIGALYSYVRELRGTVARESQRMATATEQKDLGL
jgi:hypothetical protein